MFRNIDTVVSMEAFDIYQKARQDHAESSEERELLGALFLQKAWADKRCSRPPFASGDQEKAVVEWIETTGEWFRRTVLESSSAESGAESRKDHFLRLFDRDPAAAVAELDTLFENSHH